MHDFSFQLPITDPILLFGIGLLVIFIVPILFSRIKLPGILGLILVGLLIGPNGCYIVEREGSIELLGNIGLMYLMFIAGLELDMLNFKKVRNRSFAFGFFTFIIPFSLGYAICFYLLDFSMLGSLLIAGMFATHTLVSYPIVSRYRLYKLESVNITVGATIITDTLVLLLLIVITSLSSHDASPSHWLRLAIIILLYFLILLVLYPLIGKWFFRNSKNDSVTQFVFVLFMVFLAGGLAIFAGIEPIIGAFLAGIALNKLIPDFSLLKNRLEFVGNALFIPFFLIYIGTFIDLRIFLENFEALKTALIFTAIAIVSKWLAAFISQKIFKYSAQEGELMFGLSTSRAAATIAVIMVGYRFEIVDISVLNAAILIILITCMVSSLVTENAAKKIALDLKAYKRNAEEPTERVLVSVVNPDHIEGLLSFAKYLRRVDTKEPVYVLSVAHNDSEIEEKLALLQYAKEITAGPIKIETVTRVDINVATGIVRGCKELQISDLVMGWNGKIKPNEWLFGSILDQVLVSVSQAVFVVSLKNPLNTIERIKVLVPNLAQLEPGFSNWLKMIQHLSSQISAKIEFCTSETNFPSFKSSLKSDRMKVPHKISPLSSVDQYLPSGSQEMDTFYILIGAREGSISYTSFLSRLPYFAAKNLNENSFAIIYPLHEQPKDVQHIGSWLSSEVANIYTDENSPLENPDEDELL